MAASVIYYGKERPKVPPSLFDCVKPSVIPTRTLAKWKSIKAPSDARNILLDEMSLFLLKDNVNDFKSMNTDIWEKCLSNKICIFDSKYEYAWFSQNIMLNTWAFRHFHGKEKSNMSNHIPSWCKLYNPVIS